MTDSDKFRITNEYFYRIRIEPKALSLAKFLTALADIGHYVIPNKYSMIQYVYTLPKT